MSLQNETELENTVAKLHRLEARYGTLSAKSSPNMRLHAATLRSYKHTINELTEEIARYRAHHVARPLSETRP